MPPMSFRHIRQAEGLAGFTESPTTSRIPFRLPSMSAHLGRLESVPGLPWRNHLSTRPTFRCCIRIDRPRVSGLGKLLNQGLIVV